MDADPREDVCDYLPTPEQIEESKAAIQARWTPEERERRTIPAYRLDCDVVRIGPTYLANGVVLNVNERELRG